MTVHINAPKGHYIGQIRRSGARRWETATRRAIVRAAALIGQSITARKA